MVLESKSTPDHIHAIHSFKTEKDNITSIQNNIQNYINDTNYHMDFEFHLIHLFLHNDQKYLWA